MIEDSLNAMLTPYVVQQIAKNQPEEVNELQSMTEIRINPDFRHSELGSPICLKSGLDVVKR